MIRSLTLLSTLLVACGGSDAEEYTILTVDGVTFEDPDGRAYLSGEGNAAISGSFSDGSVFYIFGLGFGGPGEFELDPSADEASLTRVGNEAFNLIPEGAWLNLTIDALGSGAAPGITGTFEGELWGDDRAVTVSGRFQND